MTVQFFRTQSGRGYSIRVVVIQSTPTMTTTSCRRGTARRAASVKIKWLTLRLTQGHLNCRYSRAICQFLLVVRSNVCLAPFRRW